MTTEFDSRISLAIDGGHNIRPDIERFLRRAGFKFELKRNGNLHAEVERNPLLRSITLNRSEDIPLRLEEGVNEFGVMGRDIQKEAQLGGMEIEEVEALGISLCKLVLEVPIGSWYQNPEDLEGARIATSYPNTARQFFREHNTGIRIVRYGGKEEGAVAAGAADAVVAVYRTGGAARENGLEPLANDLDRATILESEGVLAAHTAFLRERGSNLIVVQFIDRVREAAGHPRRRFPSIAVVIDDGITAPPQIVRPPVIA